MITHDSFRNFSQIAAFRKKKVKSFPVRVCSLDSTLEFDLQNNSTGEIGMSALERIEKFLREFF